MTTIHELEFVADHLGGLLETPQDDFPYIVIDTGDNTSKENYDDLIETADNIRLMLSQYKVIDKWADHDTQILAFDKVAIDNE